MLICFPLCNLFLCSFVVLKDLLPRFITRAVKGCGLLSFLNSYQNYRDGEASFVQEDYIQAMVDFMEQAWDYLLKCTLKPGTDENKDTGSIFSVINMTYSETTSGHATSMKAWFDKSFVK